MSLADQLSTFMGAPDRATGREMYRTGLTLAKVTNIKDEKNLNRVKCLPISGDETEETDWCYVMAPMGGSGSGAFFFPQVNDLVVLAFLDGDPHRPLVLGAYWNTDTKAPLTVKDGKSEDYMLRTPKGIEVKLHDTDKKQQLALTMPSGTALTLDDEKSNVSIQDKNGENALTLDLKGGNVTLKAKTKVTIQAGQTSLVLESGGNITLKGNGKISLQGTDIQAKANAKLALQGTTGEIKASATLDLNASGPASLKGAIVKIN